jgi:hypothetical protein
MTPVEHLTTAAKQACYDANEIVRLIDVLRAGNDKEIFPEINRRKAAPTAIQILNALFTRLHLVVCRHYGPVRDDDYSAGTAFKYLSDPVVVDELVRTGSRREILNDWRLKWEVYGRDPKLKAYIHIRNKEVAHLAFKNPNIQPPIIKEMFDAGETTAMLLDELARAVGCSRVTLEFERKEQKKSAEAFWGIWKSSLSDSETFAKNESESDKSPLRNS